MSGLPAGWCETSIFEISKPKQWKTIPKKKLLSQGYTVYGANGIIGYYSEYTHLNRTLMITCRGASCGNVHISLPKSYINGNAMALDNFSSQISIEYVYYFLKHDDFKNVISGSAQPQITQEGLKKLKLKIAPLNEQIRIANKLDSLLGKLQATQKRLDKIPTLLKRYRQSVLAAAVSGELVELESLEKLILGDVATIQTGNTPLKSNSAFYENGKVPWLTSTVTGQKLVTHADKFVTELAVKECRLKVFSKGTLLVAMYGEGKTRGQVTEIAIDATINQACAAVTVNETLASKSFIKICIENNYEQTRLMAEGGAQPNLNLTKVRSIPIILPSLKEQKQIVKRVEALFKLADQAEQHYQAAKQRSDKLTQSILAKAFRGELVPQDPNDEPASELLKRIKNKQLEKNKLLKSKVKKVVKNR